MRISFKPGLQNTKQTAMVNRDRVLLPPLYIKLGLMKQLVEALKRKSNVSDTYSNNF